VRFLILGLMVQDYRAKILQSNTPNIFKVMRGGKRMRGLPNYMCETRKGKNP
jgi:hypothetical protein